ncbi:hypothetical protein HOLleu_44536 [Holothuria leucospilota]|uniref:Uncharacterized protein n=1 Tax=Holothuria leucospilota TaxID=206669 RepID=A0A9Q0YAM2_HOLLE|nr:hypothetical protein HOLleu_44536 [Holothuria leucospilota]
MLDRHAPLVRMKVLKKDKPEWLTDDLLSLKRSVRKAEKKWRKSPSEENKARFSSHRHEYREKVRHAKWQNINTAILDCGNDTKQLFRTVNNLIGRKQDNPLPESDSSISLANDFANHFLRKINTIRDNLQEEPLFIPPINDCKHLMAFQPLSESQVLKLIQRANPTYCPMDPFPTSLLKAHVDVLLPILTSIVNESLTMGSFSFQWKTATVCPLLKKPGLDTVVENYRPVNN